MLLGNPHQLFGDREDVGLLRLEIWRGSCPPFPAPCLVAAGGAGQDAGPHPKLWKTLARREVHTGHPLVKYAISGELLPPEKVKRCCN
jgi:hypothetical protein